MAETRIGARDIPIKDGRKTLVRFSGGDIGRRRAGGDPGERWRRMDGAHGYEKLYAW